MRHGSVTPYWLHHHHYNDVIMCAMASQITSLTIVYSTVYSGANQRKHQKFRVTGLCAGNSPATGEFPAQMASYAENVSIWWRHHDCEWLLVINLLILMVVVSLVLGESYDHPMTAKLKKMVKSTGTKCANHIHTFEYILYFLQMPSISLLCYKHKQCSYFNIAK